MSGAGGAGWGWRAGKALSRAPEAAGAMLGWVRAEVLGCWRPWRCLSACIADRSAACLPRLPALPQVRPACHLGRHVSVLAEAGGRAGARAAGGAGPGDGAAHQQPRGGEAGGRVALRSPRRLPCWACAAGGLPVGSSSPMPARPAAVCPAAARRAGVCAVRAHRCAAGHVQAGGGAPRPGGWLAGWGSRRHGQGQGGGAKQRRRGVGGDGGGVREAPACSPATRPAPATPRSPQVDPASVLNDSSRYADLYGYAGGDYLPESDSD